MTYLIKYEDGPCAWSCKEVVIKAASEDKAIAKLMRSVPRAMVTSVEEVK